jgi:predicted glycogen debranching enzyme
VIVFGPQTCGDLDAGASREWLVPDGLGGYAMGSVCGLRTRRYHALQVVSGATPAARMVGLVALDPVLTLSGGARVELGVHEWAGGVVHPTGHTHLARFDLVDGVPRWRWRVGDVVLERTLAMAHGAPSLGVVYRLVAGGPVSLVLDTLVTWRDAHGERDSGGGDLRVEAAADGCVVEDAYRLAGPGWQPAGGWWRGAHTRDEASRGLAATEDLWHAGCFTATLRVGEAVEVSSWAGDLAERPAPPGELVAAAAARSRAVVARARPADTTAARWALAADAFVVAGTAGPDVVAGYPWFGTWSRDTMISYEGLFLATGRVDEGRALLRGYGATLSEGMLANTADTGRTEHNTVDATLWFLHAVERHVTATGDTDLAAELLPALVRVVDAHLAGTRYGIRVDPADALVTQGADGYALTWMDARIDGVPVTPRHGKPVEINALWVNGLGGLATLTERAGVDPGPLRRLRDRAAGSFARRFPAPGGDRLYDVVDGPAGDDPAFRPNQLFAYSLPYAPLPPDPRVVDAVAERLLTPLGLRTLDPADPAHQPHHRGSPAERDRAYHQGTVWPWLLGAFVDAAGHSHDTQRQALATIDAHLEEWGLGSISETAESQPPHRATGCPFQAWSVAEFGRVRKKIG